MKNLFAAILFVSPVLASADQLCGRVKNLSTLDTDMIVFNLILPSNEVRVFQVKPQDVERVRSLALTALNNPRIRLCVRPTEMQVELTNLD